MSDFWVRKDRNNSQIGKDLIELFSLDLPGPETENMGVLHCSEYVELISIFVFKACNRRYGEN